MLQKLDEKIIEISIAAKCKLESFLTKEDGAVDIVAIVVLIGIVVLVAIIFRKAISNLINNLFKTIENNANNAVNGV